MANASKPIAEPEADLVRRLAEILDQTGLSEIEVERDGLKVRVARAAATQTAYLQAPPPMTGFASPLPAPAVPATPAIEPTARDGETVKSPMVGTVYLQAQPGSPPFVRLGDRVSAGQTVLLIEAMKTMNPIAAPREGKVLEILVADAQPVEYGEPLIVLG